MGEDCEKSRTFDKWSTRKWADHCMFEIIEYLITHTHTHTLSEIFSLTLIFQLPIKLFLWHSLLLFGCVCDVANNLLVICFIAISGGMFAIVCILTHTDSLVFYVLFTFISWLLCCLFIFIFVLLLKSINFCKFGSLLLQFLLCWHLVPSSSRKNLIFQTLMHHIMPFSIPEILEVCF